MAATRARSWRRSGEPGVRPIRTYARTVGPQPEGEWRSLGPVADDVLAAPEHPHAPLQFRGQLLGPHGSRAAPLAAEGAPVGQRGRRLAPGKAPTGVGLDVGRFHPRRLQRERPLPLGARRKTHRMHQRHGAVPPLHLRGFRSSRREPVGQRCVGRNWADHHLARCAQLHGRAGRSRVVGEAPAAHHDLVARPLCASTLRAGPATGPATGRPPGVTTAARPRRPVPRPRARHNRLRRWTAIRCSGRGAPTAPTRRRGG